MDNDERKADIAILELLVTCIVLLVLFNSCKQIQYVDRVQEVIRVDTQVQHDSVYVRDSIYVENKGDTIYLTKWKDKYLYKYIYNTDSIVRVDSIPYPVYVKEEVVRNSGFAKFCITVFWTIIGSCLLWIGYKIVRFRLKL